MSNIYLLYGEEKYDINQKIEKIKRSFENLITKINQGDKNEKKS